MSTQARVRRRWPLILILLAIGIAVGIVAATVLQRVDARVPKNDTPRESVPSATDESQTPIPVEVVTAEVDESGFAAAVDGVSITGASGVAPEGLQLQATLGHNPENIQSSTWGALSPLSRPVEVNFTDGSQPLSPVTITFDLSGVEVPISDQRYPVVTAEDEGGNAELIDADWDASSQTLTAQVRHFTKFTAMMADLGKAHDAFVLGVQKALEMRFDQPDCYAPPGDVREDGLSIGPIRGSIVWPCLVERDGTVSLSLHSNSPIVWGLSSELEPVRALPLASSAAGVVALTFHEQVRESDSLGAVVPGGSAEFTIDAVDLPVDVELNALSGVMVVHLLAQVIQETVSDKWIERINWAECGLDGLGVAVDEENMPQLIKTVLGCFGQAVGGLRGIAISLASLAPAALGGMISGAIGEFVDGNNIVFEVSKNHFGASDGVLPAGMRGVWRGSVTGYQDWYDVQVILKQVNNQILGSISYPGLDCGGTLTYVGTESGVLNLKEEITYGASCIEHGDVWLGLDGETLKWKYQIEDDIERFLESDMVRR